MRRLPVPNESIHIFLPRETMADVRLLLHDPKTGKLAYGELSSLIARLLANWVDDQRMRAPVRPQERPIPDPTQESLP
jgi:hypothetical protein